MLSSLREALAEVAHSLIPVCVVVITLQFTLVWMPMEMFARFLMGAILVFGGLVLFLQGVRIGLLPLGEMMGSSMPNLGSVTGIIIVALILGFSVTVAEPDVRVLAHQVEAASGGQVDKGILIAAVALGVAVFVCLALVRILLGVPIAYPLGAGYLIILALIPFIPRHFLPVAFDAGGVTTGPLTVPFILSLGIGMTSVLGGKSPLSDGFGLVGLASIGPVLAVMLLGVIFG